MIDLQGVVDNIVFQSEENGFTIARIKENEKIITVSGCMPQLREGQNLKFEGEWITHPKFGLQFKASSMEEILPTTTLGIEKYLSSGVISGIGPVTAKKIVSFFGDKTLEVLDNNIERLNEIEGIGAKKIKVIYESYSKQTEVRNIMIFLQTYGVTAKQCVKIYNKYGKNSIEVVKENPYRLNDEINGIGFKTADKIAISLGIDKNSSFRIESGIKYLINEFCMIGNTYMPLDKLTNEAIKVLQVTKDEVEENIIDTAMSGNIKIETIEGNQCVFTIPFYYSELGVTQKVITLKGNIYHSLDINVVEEISEFEKGHNISFDKSQKEAIGGALENGIEIITGGPGTGKTTIINCIADIFESAGKTVFMAAPTGRAAKRMTEATGRESKTIHRLLELGLGEEDGQEFFRGEDQPLECDVLILDEASMIDVMLMNNLLKSVSIGTRLIIVGDVDQLPSVGPGNVLRDIIESGAVKVVRLKEIFRQGKKSMIVVNAHKINNSEMPITNQKESDFFFLKSQSSESILDVLLELIHERLPKFNKDWNSVKHIQILSPMRKGILGVENLNTHLQEMLNPEIKGKDEIESKGIIYRVGDKVMQTKNNYKLKWHRTNGSCEELGEGVFNGDIAYIIDIDKDKHVTVKFEDDKIVEYEELTLDELTLAYAITIHKSQGSEFPVVIMPMYMGAPLLMNKNLLYTGVTRAKKMVVLVGMEKALSFMVKNDRSFERFSALRWRIETIIGEESEK
ncbi:MAG: ATP-dependent RecD-like DNA helicase [Clostridium sp.]